MKVTEQDLRERYESLETEQLLELQAQGTLTETATRVLEQVLAGRSVTAEQAAVVTELKKQVDEQNDLLASLATPGERLAAQFIDSFVTGVILIPSVLLWPVAMPLGAGGAILAVCYLLLADGLPKGQSIGKRAVGIAVIDQRSHKPCSYGQSFVRNFLLALLGIIDWIFIFGRMHQRLGDTLASTIVVRLRRPAEVAITDDPI